MSWIGSFLVIVGVFVYNHAKKIDKQEKTSETHKM
jgi:hypothetical protein